MKKNKTAVLFFVVAAERFNSLLVSRNLFPQENVYGVAGCRQVGLLLRVGKDFGFVSQFRQFFRFAVSFRIFSVSVNFMLLLPSDHI